MATLERIWIKRAHKGPMDEVREAEAVLDGGLSTSADQGGQRQVTILSAERWTEIMAELDADLDPVVRRANLFVTGIDLVESRGRIVRIGDVELTIRGETRPCALMDEIQPGLQEALRARWGGGAFAQVTRGGTIRAGDSVSLLDPA
ncbi:MAG: MOSC domain-containing protein [Planctomycetota bacterium]